MAKLADAAASKAAVERHAGSNPALGTIILGYRQAVRHTALTRASLVRIQLPQPFASVAQLVEQSLHTRLVAGSNPAIGTIAQFELQKMGV